MERRYREDGQVRLPCNDVMIADSMSCSNTVIYCRKATDMVSFAVHGAGEIFNINKECKDIIPDFDSFPTIPIPGGDDDDTKSSSLLDYAKWLIDTDYNEFNKQFL